MRSMCITVLCLLAAADVDAQRIIYDGKRDTTAQQSVAAAKEITSGTLFEAMLTNVDAQAKLEVDTATAWAQQQMLAKLYAFRVWHDPLAVPTTPALAKSDPKAFIESARRCPQSIACELSRLRQRHLAALTPVMTPEELDKRLAQIKARQAELQAELKKLQAASKSTDPLVVRAFAALEDPGGDIIDAAQKVVEFAKNSGPLAVNVGTALNTLESGLEQVMAVYRAIEGIWRGQQAVSVDPASLRPPSQQIDIQLLALEQSYLTRLARIKARQELEVGAALARVDMAIGLLQANGLAQLAEPIEVTLRNAANAHERERLQGLLMTLHEVAASVAQVDVANRLADLRTSDEERRYSIRRSAVNTSTYDLTIQAATQRLALYWKSGIKPAELAQLAFYITNTIALPAIAIKQE